MGRRGLKRKGFGPSGFEEWGGYMKAKVAKLQDQFSNERENKAEGIFSGIAIFVNGYTEIGADELKRMMLIHGGIFHHYYSRKSTTHIIASNLPNSKINNLDLSRIVSPKWITDSVASGKLLDYSNYRLYSNVPESQPKIKSVLFKSEVAHEEVDSKDVFADDAYSAKEGRLQGTPGKIETDSSVEVPFNCTKNAISKIDNSFEKNNSNSVSTANPNFLHEFYANSRLHHLSTMGSMFKDYVRELQKKFDNSGINRLKAYISNQNRCGPTNIDKLEKLIMHIDMDCFFVSVGLRNRPELKGLPVAVTHSKGKNPDCSVSGSNRKYEIDHYRKKNVDKIKTKCELPVENLENKNQKNYLESHESMAEIASCSYEARKAGLRNGMFLGAALKLCPNLQTLQYDFEGYKEVSYCLYNVVASYTKEIEAVSCDEMYADLTELLHNCEVTPLELASCLREHIKEVTECPSSIGMGPNMLIARLATKQAKPNGQTWISSNDIAEFMKNKNISDLPGVGWALGNQLEEMKIKTCGDLQKWNLVDLQKEFGVKTGKSLSDHCRGIDNRYLTKDHQRKSVSAEVNYGIRFQNKKDSHDFIEKLSEEVCHRLTSVGLKGRSISLKLKVRSEGAPVEAAKFMGHGICDNIIKTVTLLSGTSNKDIVLRECLTLLTQLKITVTDIRGIGIQISKLENEEKLKSIKKYFKPGGATETKPVLPAEKKDSSKIIDIEVLRAIPEELREQIISEYKAEGFIIPPLLSDLAVPGPSGVGEENEERNITSFSQINSSFLEALPTEIQDDIRLDFAKNKVVPKENAMMGLKYVSNQSKGRGKKSNRGRLPGRYLKKNNPPVILQQQQKFDDPSGISSLSSTTVNVPCKGTKSTNDTEAFNRAPSFCGETQMSCIKSLLKEWFKSTLYPEEKDISFITSYCKELIHCKDLEALDLLLKFINRALRRSSFTWQMAYTTILNDVQNRMLQKYGGKLKIL